MTRFDLFGRAVAPAVDRSVNSHFALIQSRGRASRIRGGALLYVFYRRFAGAQSGRDNCCPIFLACMWILLCFSYPIFCHNRTLAVTAGDGSRSKGVVTGFFTPFGTAGFREVP